MNLEENFSMCFKHLYHLQYSLTYFEHFVLTDENKIHMRKMHAKLNELITNLNAHVRI